MVIFGIAAKKYQRQGRIDYDNNIVQNIDDYQNIEGLHSQAIDAHDSESNDIIGKRWIKPISSPLSIIFCPSDAISMSDVDCISIGLGSYTIDEAGRFCLPCSCFTNEISATLQGSNLRLRG